jgi:hypothetical protein
VTIDQKLWDNWKHALRKTKLRQISKTGDEVINFETTSEDGTSWNLPLRPRHMYAMGCDIVGYSRRSLEGQLYLTTSLFVAMDIATTALRQRSWLSATEPCAVLPTGDGALVVTGSLQDAFALTLTLNMLMEDLNRGPAGGVEEKVEREQPCRILPCEVRFALAGGRLVEICDVTNRRNFVGEALVTCARILAASKGAHFLAEEGVVAEILRSGGLNEIARVGAPWSWGQELHAAKLQPRTVKGESFAFYNIFGFYNSEDFLAAAGAPEEFSGDTRRYAIGSHDVSCIG